MRWDAPASSAGAAGGGTVGMEVVDDDEGRGMPDKGKGRVVPGGIGGAVPGHLMRRLQTLSLRLVEKYALLSQKDRGLACQGLCQLWLAFSGPGQGDNLSSMVRAEGTLQLARYDGVRVSHVSTLDFVVSGNKHRAVSILKVLRRTNNSRSVMWRVWVITER